MGGCLLALRGEDQVPGMWHTLALTFTSGLGKRVHFCLTGEETEGAEMGSGLPKCVQPKAKLLALGHAGSGSSEVNHMALNCALGLGRQ